MAIWIENIACTVCVELTLWALESNGFYSSFGLVWLVFGGKGDAQGCRASRCSACRRTCPRAYGRTTRSKQYQIKKSCKKYGPCKRIFSISWVLTYFLVAREEEWISNISENTLKLLSPTCNGWEYTPVNGLHSLPYSSQWRDPYHISANRNIPSIFQPMGRFLLYSSQ